MSEKDLELKFQEDLICVHCNRVQQDQEIQALKEQLEKYASRISGLVANEIRINSDNLSLHQENEHIKEQMEKMQDNETDREQELCTEIVRLKEQLAVAEGKVGRLRKFVTKEIIHGGNIHVDVRNAGRDALAETADKKEGGENE